MSQGFCGVIPGKVLCGIRGPHVDWLVENLDLDVHEPECKLTCRAAT